MENPKYITYNGLRFCRDEKTGYYLNSTIHKRLHRYVWETEVGDIPKGCQIHHIDGNKANNSITNLAIMTATGHQRLHGQEIERKAKSRENIKKATAAAPAWHRSTAGYKWHSEHMQGYQPPRYDKTCEYCGATYQGTKAQRFCSNKCKAAHRRKSKVDYVEQICIVCGKPFMTDKYRNALICSVECKGKHRTLQNDEKRKRGEPLRRKSIEA